MLAKQKFNALLRSYPGQFWIILILLITSSTAASFVWPFLTIFFREKLNASLTIATSFLAIESVGTIASAYSLSSLMDKHGRKWIGVGSLIVHGVLIMTMVWASNYMLLAALAFMRGIVNPLFRMTADTMIADLIPEEQRVDAYAILRVGANVGFALGPIWGGMLVTLSYSLDFMFAGVLLVIIGIYAAWALKESLIIKPSVEIRQARSATEPTYSGNILKILRDGFFMAFFASDLLTKMAYMLVFSIMSAYLKDNVGINESQYGLLMGINAGLGVFFQFAVTRITKRYQAMHILIVGSLLYAIGTGLTAFGNNFTQIAICIIIVTVAELMYMPTAINEVARIAPAHMRARYLGFYSLTNGLARGFSPLMGGLLSDLLFPKAIWYGGALMAGLSSLGFVMLLQKMRATREAQ